MPDQPEKNEPAPTQKIPPEELRKLLSNPDMQPFSEEDDAGADDDSDED